MPTFDLQEANNPLLQLVVFPNARATSLKREQLRWLDLVRRLERPQERPHKAACELLKLAAFGDTRTPKGCLRHDANLLDVCGLEGDYDAGQLSLDEAADRLAALGVEAFFYTSPSHTPEAPRWRVLAPLSRPRAREGRRQLLGVLNAALGGVLTPESFTDSQTYYFGRVTGVEYQTRHTRGVTIDALELALEPVLPTSARASAGPSPQASSVPPLGLTTEQLRCALGALDADTERRKWLDVLMAVHHETAGSEEGFALVDEWSSTGAKYEGSDDVRGRWDSFGHNGRSPTTAHALVRMANEAGAQIEIAQLEAANDFDVVEVAPAAPRPLKFPPISADAFIARPSPGWIVKGIVPRAEVMVIFGESGAGKSFVALDLFAAVARGVPFMRCKSKPGRVVYVAAEGAGGFRNRLKAYCKANELDPAELPFVVVDGAPNLLQRDDAAEVARTVAAAGGAAVVVVDTLAQVTPGANENASEGMGKAIEHCKAIHRATGALVVLIHHSGKDQSRGARGWSGLKGAVDAELEVTRTLTGRAIRVSKQKDGHDGAVWGFELDQLAIDVDEDGDAITSCVVREVAPPAHHQVTKLGKWQRAALDAVTELGGTGAGAKLAEVMTSAIQIEPPPPGKRDRRAEAVREALDELVNRCVLEIADDRYRIV